MTIASDRFATGRNATDRPESDFSTLDGKDAERVPAPRREPLPLADRDFPANHFSPDRLPSDHRPSEHPLSDRFGPGRFASAESEEIRIIGSRTTTPRPTTRREDGERIWVAVLAGAGWLALITVTLLFATGVWPIPGGSPAPGGAHAHEKAHAHGKPATTRSGRITVPSPRAPARPSRPAPRVPRPRQGSGN